MRAFVLALALGSVACGGYYGVQGEIFAPTDPSGRREVIVVPGGPDDMTVSDARPVAGTTITCEGCSGAKVDVDERGHFYIAADAERPARPVVLHVTAPGCKPVVLEIPRFGPQMRYGLPRIVIVLERAPPS